MALKYWWLLPLGLAAVAAVVILLWRRQGIVISPTPVAHAERLTELPAYKQALASYRKRLVAAVVALAVLAVSLLVAAARPVSESSTVPEQFNRDIMLCLDVSGSMLDTDVAIMGVFSQLVGKFQGERIAMTIFDSSAVMVFPLTDDYEFVAGELAAATKALGSADIAIDYLAGTHEADGSSLIGDGLASCVKGFPAAENTAAKSAVGDNSAAEKGRSRSIILATDNMLAGRPLFTLEQATELAKTANTRVYAFNPNDYGSSDYGSNEFGMFPLLGDAAVGLKQTASATGGAYYALESEEAVASIVEKVQATEASRLLGAPHKSLVDHPGVPLGIAAVALLALALLRVPTSATARATASVSAWVRRVRP
ncbi:VWA domain-containing protein [Arthrobacter sp. E3]|uniref:VWA domain-containing protein n=1 Tax=Arthrobacter sp. E3 TaxID=517402 RepID=UPI001A94BA44|nr:VWA domain-containing protein [Arthrobacter sp. E3]